MIISNIVLGAESRETDQAPCLQQAGGWCRLNEEFRARDNSRVRKPPLCEETVNWLKNTSGYSTNQVFRLKSDHESIAKRDLRRFLSFELRIISH